MGIIIFLVVLVLLCMPELLLFLIVYGVNERGSINKKAVLQISAVSTVIFGAIYLLVQRFIMTRWNFLKTIKEVLKFDISYTHLECLTVSLFLGCCVAVVIAMVVTFVIRSKGYRSTLSQRKKCIFLLGMVGISILAYFLYYESRMGVRSLTINEVCSYNELTAINADGEIADYIEIYNPGSLKNRLDDIYISDDYTNLKKFRLAGTAIEPKGFGLIALMNESISLNKSGGETIYLSDGFGHIIDQVTICELGHDQAYARVEDGEEMWDVVSCTPGNTNSNAVPMSDAYVAPPELSYASGFYEEAFELAMAADESNAVYYTLDGTEPDKENGILYQGPVLIEYASKNPNVIAACEEFSANNYYVPENSVDKGTILKARAYDEEDNYSDVVTALYFVDSEDTKLSDKYGDIPVVSLVADPDELIGYDNGILVLGKKFDEYKATFENGVIPKEQLPDYRVGANFNQKGKAWEREAVLSFFENGQLQLHQTVGIRRRGKSSSTGAQKGFNIYAREIYSDTSSLGYDVFGSKIPTERAILKYAKCLLRDGFIMDLVTDRDLIPFNYTPVSFFLNGEYWGTYTMIERYEERFFKNHYGVNDVTIFCNDAITVGDPKDDLRNVFTWAAEHDLSVESNYEVIAEQVDLQSLIDYYCVRIFMDSYDTSETYNMMAWKPEYNESNIYADGKWRWVVYDIDNALVDYTRNNLTEEIRETRPAFLEHTLIKALLANEEFKTAFVTSFTDMINFNFSPDIVVPLYEERVAGLYDELQNNNIRFYGTKIEDSTFETDREFYEKRPEYVLKYLKETFDLDDAVTMKISTESGNAKIQVNTSCVEIGKDAKEVVYFPDMEIEISVSPEAEEEFGHWIIREDGSEFISTEMAIQVEPKEGTEIILVNK